VPEEYLRDRSGDGDVVLAKSDDPAHDEYARPRRHQATPPQPTARAPREHTMTIRLKPISSAERPVVDRGHLGRGYGSAPGAEPGAKPGRRARVAV
jgi:hypothetical protein